MTRALKSLFDAWFSHVRTTPAERSREVHAAYSFTIAAAREWLMHFERLQVCLFAPQLECVVFEHD